MAHAVDFVLNVMKGLSTSEPVLFQRDGSLFVASEQGFGMVKNGLSPLSDIKESEDIISRWDESSYDKKPVFKDGEIDYLRDICFGSDDKSFSLDEIAKSAKQLSSLKNDGKIRMVRHGSQYHSHKYGYAADGIDVYLLEARVMDREKYVQMIRDKEIEMINKLKDSEFGSKSRLYFEEHPKIPDCVIITPRIAITLPRPGSLEHSYVERPDAWTEQTRMTHEPSGTDSRSILRYKEMNTFTESPYRVSVKINAREIGSNNWEKLTQVLRNVVNHISRELLVVNSYMEYAQEFVAGINAIHNEMFAKNIEQSNQWKAEARK